jgi:hypothetical protein
VPRKRLVQGFGVVASVVALLVGLTSLVDWLERRTDDPPPAPRGQVDARLESVAVRDRAMPLGDYLSSTRQSTRGLNDLELAEPGLVFSVRVRLRGGLDEKFPLVWTLHGASSGIRLKGPIYNQPAAVTFSPRSHDDAREWPVWVPYPRRTGVFFLRATLTDEKRQPEDARDSKPFRIAEIPAPR